MAKRIKTTHQVAILLTLATLAAGTVIRLHTPVQLSLQQQAKERAKTPMGMVYVPGGECLLGSNDADKDEDIAGLHREYVPSFYMDRTEVTNAAYKQVVPSHTFPPGEENLPVTNVVYAEAEVYAKAVGKRLPTEAEWEKAARGVDGRRFPWGNDFEGKRVASRAHPGKVLTSRPSIVKKPGQCATGQSRVRPVGSAPDGISPYGCVDMAGNAWEWVQGYYQGNSKQRLLRGGAVGYGQRDLRTYSHAIEGAEAT